MKKCILFVLLFPCLHIAFAQNEIQVVKIEQLKKVYTHANDTTYIINFFATWCGPCMQEMPILNQFYEDNKNTSKKLIFVSLDNAGYLKKLPTKLKKIGIKAPVYLLNESSDFSWLPYIDKRWQEWIDYESSIIGNYGKSETVHG